MTNSPRYAAALAAHGSDITFTAAEVKLRDRWLAATPRIPGNSIPNFTLANAMRWPEGVIRNTYTEMVGRIPKARTVEQMRKVLFIINEAIEDADARCQASRA